MLHHKRWLRRKFRVAIFTLVATNRIRSLIRTMKVTPCICNLMHSVCNSMHCMVIYGYLFVIWLSDLGI